MMNKMQSMFFMVIGLGCFYSSSQAMEGKGSLGYYLNYLEGGPLKNACENCNSGCLCKTEEEKARNYIVDYLRKHDTPEVDKPMTTVGGYWGDWMEVVGMTANASAMKARVRVLIQNESDDIKWQELDKISRAGEAIKKARKEQQSEKEKLLAHTKTSSRGTF
jgi:hypothetical protein